MKLYRVPTEPFKTGELISEVSDRGTLGIALREKHTTIEDICRPKDRPLIATTFLQTDCICYKCNATPREVAKAIGGKYEFAYVDTKDGNSLIYIPVVKCCNYGELDNPKREVEEVLTKGNLSFELKVIIEPGTDYDLDSCEYGYHEKTKKKTSEKKPQKKTVKRGSLDSNGVYRPVIEECEGQYKEDGLDRYELESETNGIVFDNGTRYEAFLKVAALPSKATAEERLSAWSSACNAYMEAMESGYTEDGEEFQEPSEKDNGLEWKLILADINKVMADGKESQFQSYKLGEFLDNNLIYTEGRGFGSFNGSYYDFRKPGVEFALAQEFVTKQLEASRKAMKNREDALKKRGLTLEDVALYKKTKPKDREELIKLGELKPVSEVELKIYSQYLWGVSLESIAKDNHKKKPKEDMVAELKPHIVVNSTELDRDDFLINTKIGVFDLRTNSKEPRKATKEDRFTCITALEPKETPEGKAMWEDHLKTIFDGDTELMHYFQVVMGMGATGCVSAEQMFFLLGTGANGKTSTLSAIERALGTDYVGELRPTVLQKSYGDNSKFIAVDSLLGKRFVHAMEIEPTASLDILMLKTLNSTGTMKGEQKFQPEFTFRKTGTVYYETNSFPFLSTEDPGVTRRVRVIPFNHKFRTEFTHGEEVEGTNVSKDDKSYKDRLFEVAGSTILAWLLDGAREAIRLKFDLDSIMPQSVREATEEALEDAQEQDGLQPFFDQWVILKEGVAIKRSELYSLYCRFMSLNHGSNHTLSAKKFSNRLMERGLGKKKAHGEWMIVGVEPIPEEERGLRLTNENYF